MTARQAVLRRQCLSVLSVQVCSSPLMSVAAIYRIARACGEYSKRYSVVSQVKAARTNPLLLLVTVSYRCRHLHYSPRMRRIAASAATPTVVCTARTVVVITPPAPYPSVPIRTNWRSIPPHVAYTKLSCKANTCLSRRSITKADCARNVERTLTDDNGH